MPLLHRRQDPAHITHAATVTNAITRKFTGTPFIVTFCETAVNQFDLHNFIELGLRVVRFKMSNLTVQDKVKLLALLDKALKWWCEKYLVSAWPVALSIDLPNAYMMTGSLSNNFKPKHRHVLIEDNSIVAVTADEKYMNLCDENLIYIDDPYSISTLKPGIEITINFGDIQMECIEIIDTLNVKCRVTKEGLLYDQQSVCLRGMKITRPILNTRDLEVVEFAKEYQFDILTINSVRRSATLRAIRKLFNDHNMPMLVSTICEQEGLDNLDDIVQQSDGIILARDYLAFQLAEDKMIPIQMYASALCKKRGKPFFIAGNILDVTLEHGKMTGNDLNDVTNAVIQGSGFVLKKFRDPPHLIRAMRLLHDICRVAEPLASVGFQFWRLIMEFPVPVNAAEATAMSSVLLAKMTKSSIIFIPTTTGRTIKQVAHVSTYAIIVAITSNPFVARKLQLYRNVVAIIYDKKRLRDWYLEIEARINFAVAYAIKFQILEHGTNFVVLRKGRTTSSYCDEVSVWTVQTDEETLITDFAAAKAMGF